MLSGIIWAFALRPVRILLMTHACPHTSTGLLGLQVTMLGHIRTCLFPCTACSACWSSGCIHMVSDWLAGCHKLPWGHCQGSSGWWLHVAKTRQTVSIVPGKVS